MAPNHHPVPVAVREYALSGSDAQADDYQFRLPDKYKQIALDELREDDNIRRQALAQFRECIAKHPNIQRCRMDAIFLLRFLRPKKFNVQAAVDNLEKYLAVRQLYSDWFQNLDPDDPEVDAIISAGYLVPLRARDEHGRQLILRCAKNFDATRYAGAKMAKVHGLIAESLMDDEESQISGYTYINDESGMSVAHLSLFSLTEMRNLIRSVQFSTPMRHKETHFINLPKFAQQIIDFIMMLLSDKLKSRAMFHSSLDDLKRKVDVKLLPKEYGGEVPLSEMIADLKTRLQERKKEIMALDESYVEITKNAKSALKYEENNLVGSFRKLEVD